MPKITLTWVSEHFSAETAHYKSENLIQFWDIASSKLFYNKVS